LNEIEQSPSELLIIQLFIAPVRAVTSRILTSDPLILKAYGTLGVTWS